MTDRLKPCPFCGEDAWLGNLKWFERGTATYAVGCTDPECIGYETICVRFETEEEALSAWNRRPGCEGCRWKDEPNRAIVCRYCSRMWLYKDMYEPNGNDEQED